MSLGARFETDDSFGTDFGVHSSTIFYDFFATFFGHIDLVYIFYDFLLISGCLELRFLL